MRDILLKIKPLSKEQIIISIDRLTRFKNPEVKYLRVFKDLLINNLISPKFKKSQLDEMDYAQLRDYAQEIINYSLSLMNVPIDEDYSINQKLLDYETKIFLLDENTSVLLKNKINYRACLNFIDENAPVNLKWLKNIVKSDDLTQLRRKYCLRFPLEKIVITEGITEEILLPEFAKICEYDFDKNGIYMLSAGGKNQVVKLFYQLAETLQIPIFVLLDKDAMDNYNEIKPKLRAFDSVHVLEGGEFEDVLPLNLIKKALSYDLKNISMLESGSFDETLGMVKNLEEIFRHRGMHEFKKADFAQIVKKNISSKDDVSPEIADIIRKIKNIHKK